MANKVQIQYDEPMPEFCLGCIFNNDGFCQLDKRKQVMTHKEEEGRPKHCILVPSRR